MDVQDIITELQLEPLQPEGGYFRQTFKDTHLLTVDGHKRAAATCIYYLLTRESFSAFHRVRGTEIFHFLRGDAAELVTIDAHGRLGLRAVGPGIESGEVPQAIVPAGEWQALRTRGAWTLFSCTVSPGFEYEDFELGDREQLLREFPDCRAWIEALTR
jgi:predicted cupin superfamily sugar epimerase